jgi:hypothetical protein
MIDGSTSRKGTLAMFYAHAKTQDIVPLLDLHIRRRAGNRDFSGQTTLLTL